MHDKFQYSYSIKDKGIILDTISVCGVKDKKPTEIKFNIWHGDTIVPISDNVEYDQYIFMAQKIVKAKEIVFEANDYGRITINKKDSMFIYDLKSGESFDLVTSDIEMR